jgi:hypothetical protein
MFRTINSLFLILSIVLSPFANAADSGLSGEYVRIRQSTLPTKCTAGDIRVDSSGALKKCSQSLTWDDVGSSSGGGINFIANPSADSNVTGWVAFRDSGFKAQSSGVDTVGDLLDTGWALGCPVGTKVNFFSSGTPPGGLTSSTDYYVKVVAGGGNTIGLSATNGGTQIDLTSVGTGNMTITPYEPCDGTGGTTTATLTRTTTNPLRGVGSFLYTPSTNAGEGFSADVTIPRGYWGRTLELSLPYELTTYANYSDGDLRWYMYDKDTGALIQAVEGRNVNKVSGPFTHSVKFQIPNNGTFAGNARIIAYQFTTTSTWAGFKFDDATLGPQNTPRGPPMTDWANWTPTVGGVTVSNTEFKWRRVGDSIEMQGRATIASTSASTFSISLPNNYKIAGDVNAWNHTPGTMYRFNTGTPYAVIGFTGSGVINAGLTAAFNSPGTGSGLFNAGDAFSFNVLFQIQGWTSNVASSSDNNGRAVYAKYRVSAATSQTANLPINFDSKVYDNAGAVTTGAGTWKFTAPVSDLYYVNIASYAATSANYYLSINGVKHDGVVPAASGVNTGSGFQVYLTAGDYIDYRCESTFTPNAGSSVTIPQGHWIAISNRSAPQTIAAIESISAAYYVSTGFAASTTVPVNFDTKEWDSHSAVTTSATAWKFTAPASGEYLVTANTVGSVGTSFYMYKNGTIYANTLFNNGSWTYIFPVKVRLLAGEYIDIRPGTGTTVTGGSRATAGVGFIQINRVGNY